MNFNCFLCSVSRHAFVLFSMRCVISVALLFSFASRSQPLHKAIEDADDAALITLLSSGRFDVNGGNDGKTPLDLAYELFGGSDEEHPIIKTLINAGGRRTSLEERAVLNQLGQTIRPGVAFYMGDRWNRGLLECTSGFEGWLCEELIKIGKHGKILDAGCGHAYIAMDMHSCRFNPDNDISIGPNFRYWPGKRPKYGCEGTEISQADYQEDEEFFVRFKTQLVAIRANAARYAGVTTKGLPESLIRRNFDVFLNPMVRIFTGRFFSEIPDEELSGQEGGDFDVVLSIFGVFPYSKTLEADVYKMFSLLKVGGKLFLKTDAADDKTERMVCYTSGQPSTFWHWFAGGRGIKLIHWHSGKKSLSLVIEKMTEVVVLPKLECEEKYEDQRMYERWVGPRYVFSAK
jgi:SAM-dependent methyltransferase